MFARAELHGVAGVILDAWKANGVSVDAELATKLESRVLARAMDYDAHRALLGRIDAVLPVTAVALKGPLFAARYYDRPSARGTTDVDLLVAESALERASEALASLGYRVADTAKERRWALRAHHHLHLVSAGAPELELHFHAYRGFGVTLPTSALAERSVVVEGLRSIRVPSVEDELVYLAVHAAAHRFGRLAWLHDLRLVVERMTPDALAVARSRARTWGVSRALALAANLLVDVLGVPSEALRPLGALSSNRGALVRAIVAEPRTRVMRAATRLAYAMMLADSVAASARYATTYSVERARQMLDLG